jgi:AcrR family transcriptional regulator
MPRAGAHRKDRPAARSSDVKERLLAAGEVTLREQGFFDASARAVADRAGVAVGGVHYHFDSVEDLLLQAFDRSSDARREDYRALVDEAPHLGALLASTTAMLEEDRQAGYFRMLSQMLAASAGSGTLGQAVAERTDAWVDVAEQAVRRFVGDAPFGVVEPRDIALGLIAFFVGLELLDEVGGDRFDSTGLLERTTALATLLASAFTGEDHDA